MYTPDRIFDGSEVTGWLEQEEGPGIGAYVELVLEEAITVDQLKIAPGYFDPCWWAANNRIKKLRITIDDHDFTATFRDERKVHNINFIEPRIFTVIRFTILEVYPTNRYDDTGISEIRFFYQDQEILTTATG